MTAITARQFGRCVAVEIVTPDGPAIRVNPDRIIALGRQQLRVQFAVEKSLSPEPNRASIKIYNLSPQRRRQIAGITKRSVDFADAFEFDILGTPFLQGKDLPGPSVVEVTHRAMAVPYVRLLAGYQRTLAGIFEGTGMRCSVQRDGTEWITTLDTEDGGLARAVPVSQSFGANTYALTIVSAMVSALGWTTGQDLSLANATLPPRLLTSKMTNGYLVAGQAVEILTQILEGLGVTWWVDDGEFWVMTEGQTLPLAPVVLDSTGTGVSAARVLSIERLEGDAIQVRMLLCPRLRLGGPVTVVHPEFSGAYRCDRLVHAGDNRGGAYQTVATLRDITARL